MARKDSWYDFNLFKLVKTFCGLKYFLSWIIFHVHLRRLSISANIGWNILYVSVRFMWCIMLFKSNISLLFFCLNNVSTVESEVLKTPTIIALILFLPSDLFLKIILLLFRGSNIRFIHLQLLYSSLLSSMPISNLSHWAGLVGQAWPPKGCSEGQECQVHIPHSLSLVKEIMGWCGLLVPELIQFHIGTDICKEK